MEKNADLLCFFKTLIALRKRYRCFRFASFEQKGDACGSGATWHGTTPGSPDWSDDSRALALQYTEHTSGSYPGVEDVYIAANSYWEPVTFGLPKLSLGRKWRRVIDASLESPDAAVDPEQAPVLDRQHSYRVEARTVVALVGK